MKPPPWCIAKRWHQFFFPTQPSLFRRAIPSLQRSKNTPKQRTVRASFVGIKLRSERFLHVGIATFSHKTHKVFFFGNVQNRRCVGRGCSNKKLAGPIGSNMSMAMDTKENRATSSAYLSASGQANINVAVVHGVIFNEVSPGWTSLYKLPSGSAVHHVIPTTSGPEWRNSSN